MADNATALRRMTNQIAQAISDKEIYMRPAFKTYMQNYAESVLFEAGVRPRITIDYDMSPNSYAGYTDGNNIHLNGGNSVSNMYSLRESRLLAFMGILFHECAHILFLDFDEEQNINETLTTYGELCGDLPYNSDAEAQYVNEILEALQNEKARPIFLSLYHELSNIFADVHDEYCICNRFHGIVERCINFSTEALRNMSQPVDEMINEDIDSPAKAFSLLLSLILQQARFDKLVIQDEDAVRDNKFVATLRNMADKIRVGCVTDDIYVKFTAINECILAMWPFIREMISPEQNQQSGSGSQDEGQSNQSGPGNSGSGSQNNSDSSSEQSNDGSQSSGSQGSGKGQPDSKQTTGGSQPMSDENSQPSSSSTAGSGADTQQPAAGSDSSTGDGTGNAVPFDGQNISDDAVNSVLDRIADALNKVLPNRSSKPVNENTISDSGSDNKTDTMSSDEAEAIAKSIMEQVASEIAKEQALEVLEREKQGSANALVQTVDMAATHKGLPIVVTRVNTISQSDVDWYDYLMGDLKPISKSLQKQIQNVLRELKEGCVMRHKHFGTKLDARDTYRLDSKCFTKKKLPQDLPDMAIAILVDESGSTQGERIAASQKAAMLIHDFATSIDVSVMVAGHHRRYGGSGIQYNIYTDFDSIDGKDKYRLSRIHASQLKNRDGMAINITADLLSKRTEDIKLLFILSDGQPNDIDYGGDAAKKDIQEIVKKYKRKGVQTFAAAIGDDKERIRDIYGDGFLDMSNLSTFPKSLAKLVQKRIIG